MSLNNPGVSDSLRLIFLICGTTSVFVIGFPLLWCGVAWLLSLIGGWRRLGQRYAAGNRAVSGERRKAAWARVGGVSYRGVLTLHLNPEGFFLDIMPLFRIGHPRLFIPWSEVSGRKPFCVPVWKAERLTIGRPVIGTVILPAKILADAPGPEPPQG